MDEIEKQPEEEQTDEVVLREQITAKVEGKNVAFKSGIVGTVSAEGDITMKGTLAGVVAAGENMEMNQSRVQIAAAGQNLTIAEGSIGLATVGQDVRIENGSIGLVNAGKEVSLQKGMIGVAIAPQVSLGEGSRVLMTTPQAAAFGAALGGAFAVVLWGLRRLGGK